MAQPDTTVVLVLTTVPPGFGIDALARQLLSSRLVACVNVLPPMWSIYRWQGAVETAEERQVLMKTRLECVPELQAALVAAHPYDVPEFLVLPLSGGSHPYLRWVAAETTPSDEPGSDAS